jgi:hypothetical protein
MTYTIQQIAAMTDRQLKKLLDKACDNDMNALATRIINEMDWREECSRRDELFGY